MTDLLFEAEEYYYRMGYAINSLLAVYTAMECGRSTAESWKDGLFGVYQHLNDLNSAFGQYINKVFSDAREETQR